MLPENHPRLCPGGGERRIPAASAAPNPVHSSTMAHSSGQTSADGLPGRYRRMKNTRSRHREPADE